MSQTWCGSTQERIRSDQRLFVNSLVFAVLPPNPHLCQLWEWPLHRCQGLFQLGTWNIQEIDFAYAVVVLESLNDVIQTPRLVARLPYDDRQGWPDGQRLPHRCSVREEEPKIQAMWRPKNNGSPSLTYVNQRVP